MWLIRFEYIKCFLKTKKRYPRIESKNKEERSLGVWVATQRIAYRKSKLKRERIEHLESLPNWIWNFHKIK